MSTYLNDLIADVKHELDHERTRLANTTFHVKATEQREAGHLKQLEQRLEVLEQLKAKEAVTNRRRTLSFAHVSRVQGHGSPRQRGRQQQRSKRAG